VKDFADRYIADHAKTKKSASSAREDRRLLDRHILPRIGSRKMVELTTADVSKIIHGMSATPVLANRVRALLSTMLSLAMVWGIRKDPINPARLVQKFPEKSRERFLSEEELKRLGRILLDLEHTSAEPWQAIAAIRLLLFTGARKSEILSLRWDFIDYDNSVLLLPKSKTGRKTIYLTATVLGILASLPRKKSCPWVLPSRLADPNRHFDGVGHVWERVREKAGLPDARLHDLRHTFASKGVGLGVGIPIIGGLLGHKNPTTTAKYAHLAADPLRAANDRIADRLEVELSGGQHANGYKRRVMVSGLEPANDDVETDGKLASGPS
jgi:integrase